MTKSYSLLIIDDDESTHDVLGSHLRFAGYDVLRATDGRAGLELIKTSKPDLVILDINMPEMNGFELMEAITADRQIRDIPVLFLSGLDRSDAKIKGLELGAEDYIVKPYNRAELLSRIKAALRRSERYRLIETTMHGNLDDLSLIELMQTFDMGRKTGRIVLKEPGAVIDIVDGNIVAATFRNFTGRDALLRAFFLARGAFSLVFGTPSAEISGMQLPINAVLFDMMVYLDELKVAVDAISPRDVLIEIGDTGIPELMPYKQLSPLPLFELLAFMEGDLKENAAILSREVDGNRARLSGGAVRREVGRAAPPESGEPLRKKFAQLFEAGFDRYREGNYEEALKIWEEAHLIDPENKILAANLPLLRKKLKVK